jgi:histidinol-phosphate aminotransferase
MKRGIIVRDMNSYGLPEWIRVSIGTMEQNRRFLAELKALPNLAIREPAAV